MKTIDELKSNLRKEAAALEKRIDKFCQQEKGVFEDMLVRTLMHGALIGRLEKMLEQAEDVVNADEIKACSDWLWYFRTLVDTDFEKMLTKSAHNLNKKSAASGNLDGKAGEEERENKSSNVDSSASGFKDIFAMDLNKGSKAGAKDDKSTKDLNEETSNQLRRQSV